MSFESPERRFSNHTNGFIDLCGVPYLLGDYVDRNSIQQLDNTLLKNDITITKVESLRTLIDISIDDITRYDHGILDAFTNNKKSDMLIDMISKHAKRLDGILDIIKTGLVVVINYRIENYRTRQIIKSSNETIRIDNRNFFVTASAADVNSNIVVTNFFEEFTSTVNSMMHGDEQLMVRIVDVHMYYECTNRGKPIPRNPEPPYWSRHYDCNEMYHHVNDHQHHINIGDTVDHEFDGYGYNNNDCCVHPDWLSYNRFYSFQDNGREIILNQSEINDINTKSFLIPCGVVHINRTMMVSPGHMLVFRVNIWKNDITLVTDTTDVCRALGIPTYQHPHHYHYSKHNVDSEQNMLIQNIMSEIASLKEQIASLSNTNTNTEPNSTDTDTPVDTPVVSDDTTPTETLTT